MTLKKNVRLSNIGNRLGDILEHDATFHYYASKGGKGYEISEEVMVEDNKSDLRMDDGGGLRRYVNETADKEPAFSLSEKLLKTVKVEYLLRNNKNSLRIVR